ncbi:N-acetylglucosamine-6-sulfatase-like isoform X2 [Tachypleus tridentatus]|uniref:N-acetylglucosamine-6-sulfatase-like isoform X2 n=1 Tax=Tachypleus tridentatus TaxID=6853 RepID=UPI003FCEFDC8
MTKEKICFKGVYQMWILLFTTKFLVNRYITVMWLCFWTTGLQAALGFTPPNIIFVLTDDQDVELGGMEPMLKTRKLLEVGGATFKNMFVTTPLCCPSRSSILTGQYVHNHGVVNNSVSGNCSSQNWQASSEKKTFVTYLKQQNYTTFYAGKYLNQYGRHSVGGVRHIPPGWDTWIGLVQNSRYYNYSLSVNGKKVKHGSNPRKDYLTNLIRRKAAKSLLEHSQKSPFFMMLSPPAPHAPFTPVPWYSKNFSTKLAPRTPNFGVYSGKGKHWLLQQPPHPLSEKVIENIDETFRNRWRTLLSVDDLVQKIFLVLKRIKALNNTYIFFSSDNGFHLGQFSLPQDKRQLYEFDIRVPLLVRGPGITPGTVVKNPVLNIDFAATFLDLAGIKKPGFMDGTSFVPLLKNVTTLVESWRTEFVVEHKGESEVGPAKGCPQYPNGGVKNCVPDCICEDSWNNTYTCLRMLSSSENSIICVFDDHQNFVEIYNITADPYQLHNLYPMNTSK